MQKAKGSLPLLSLSVRTRRSGAIPKGQRQLNEVPIPTEPLCHSREVTKHDIEEKQDDVEKQ